MTPASATALSGLLHRHAAAFSPVIPSDLNADNVCVPDLSAANPLLRTANLTDTVAFEQVMAALLQQQQARIGIGGYLENRIIYRRSPLFDEAADDRSIHLGIDIWTEAGMPVLAPLPGVVFGFADNANFGDYGPTIVLEHRLEEQTFYTLFGHLSRSSLQGLAKGKRIEKGEQLAEIGPYPENGDWPPHLHFQVIADMLGMESDFPGVAAPAEADKFRQLCPNPNLILQCRHLPAGW